MKEKAAKVMGATQMLEIAQTPTSPSQMSSTMAISRGQTYMSPRSAQRRWKTAVHMQLEVTVQEIQEMMDQRERRLTHPTTGLDYAMSSNLTRDMLLRTDPAMNQAWNMDNQVGQAAGEMLDLASQLSTQQK